MSQTQTLAGASKLPAWRSTLFRVVPALDSLRHYSPRDLAADTMAGLTVAAVAVPQAMAYAQIAGLPPQYGLYTAIVMTAVGALLDSSKQLINGPTNAISIAVLSAMVGFSDSERIGAAILLALMVGVVQTGISLLRLGDLSRFISHAVIVGFTLGAAVLLVLDQLKNLLGLPALGTGEDHFLKRTWLTLSNFHQTNYAALALGVGAIAVALIIRWINFRLRIQLPDLLLAVIAAAAAVGFWQLDERGVKVVGEIPARLPSFAVPELKWSHIRELSTGAVAIAVLGLLEAVAMAKAIAARTRQKLDINQQCLSEGVANSVGSFFQCYPGSGSLTRSNINVQAGARTQWSGVISAAAVALTVVLFAPYAYYIPRAGLAGILILSAWRLVNRHELAYYLRTTRYDALIVLITAVSAVAISIEFCVLIGILMSFLLYVPQAARVHVSELVLAPDRVIRERRPEDVPCNRIRLFSLEGELFFGAAPQLESHLEAVDHLLAGGVRVIVLRVKYARNPDAVCLAVLERFIERMAESGVVVLLCGVRPDLVKALDASRIIERAGDERVVVFPEHDKVWTSTREAVEYAYHLIGNDKCGACPACTTPDANPAAWSYYI
jgi:SulP family sulfate permease